MQNLGQAAGSAVGAPPGGLQAKILRILQRSPQPLTPHDLDCIRDPYQVVTANLRFPTLHDLCGDLTRLTGPQGVLVLSGVRTDEAPRLIRRYRQNAFALRWRSDEKGWVGLGFRKLPPDDTRRGSWAEKRNAV